MTSSLEPLIVIWPNSTGMIPGWSRTKTVLMVLIGCICRSRGQKIGFQKAIFKNVLVWNYKAQSFHIWYIALSIGPLPKLFKLCPWDQNWPRPGVTILHWQGSHGQGKVREKWFFFKVREKSGNFEIGQGNLKKKQKSGKSQGIL